eukprot:1160167-Pelagomonas_calceolata.AAC.2
MHSVPGTPSEAAMEEGFCHAYIYSCAHQPSCGPLLVCACNDGVLRFWALQTTMVRRGGEVQRRVKSSLRLRERRSACALVVKGIVLFPQWASWKTSVDSS